MKRLFKYLLIIVIFSSTFCFFYFNRSVIISSISSVFSKKNILEEGFFVISVLDRKLYDDAHIEGSINVELDEIRSFLSKIDKASQLVFYCTNTMCASSDEAAKIAIGLGYSNIYVYRGGIADWYQKSKKENKFLINGSAEMSYLKMFFAKDDNDEEEKLSKNKIKYKIINAECLQKMIEDNKLYI